MHETYLIGIDIGTGSTKAIALSEKGTVLAKAQQFYSTISEGEKSEQEVFPVLNAFQQCIRQIVDQMQAAPVAVSLSSAMHSILAVDENGKPLTNAILWSDTRSSGIAESLRTSAEGVPIYHNTGTPLHSMSPLCKIAWLRQYEPQIFSRTAKFISIKEFIWHQLFREYVIDHSLASATGLFHIVNLGWDETALCYAGIDARKLSTPVPVMYTRKGLSDADAAAMKLPAETHFLIGGSDGCLANLGSLCLQPSKAAITIGTSAAVRVTTAVPVQQADRMIFNYLLNETTFVCGGAVNNGGNVFQWLLENLFQQHASVSNYDQLFALLDKVPAGSEGLLFLPYLHGERAPVWDEKSCGVYIGMRSVHTLPYFARAAAEGVCLALLHILASLEEVCGTIEEIAVSGGVVQSNEMMQLLADVTGKTVLVQQSEDASAIGAAYLAQRALGIINDFTSLVSAPDSVFRPQKEKTDLYQKLFSIYKG
ncbi:MAG TPA: gluconokinase, partial [Flavisolibacter sp.]|nr:gluconokinase [Flavisolibacter sp.]